MTIGITRSLRPRTSKYRILIADDDPKIRTLLKLMLEKQDYEVIEAKDGQEVLDSIPELKPDLVILDVQMPRLDGFTTCDRIKSDPKTRLLPVIILTTLSDDDQKIKGVTRGADDYVGKPFNPTILAARVQALLSLKRFTDDLENASRIMESLALAVEGRDRYTSRHCRRLSAYASAVGKKMGSDEETLHDLRLGGIFHDLGKIVISDGILNKNGALTPKEWEDMRTHPVSGADLVKEMRSLHGVHPLIRHHHEHLDGSGYPDGLSGDQISLPIRIISVVDVYDALSTKRSYKEAFPKEKCFSILDEEVGRGWWDVEVVRVLKEHIELPG